MVEQRKKKVTRTRFLFQERSSEKGFPGGSEVKVSSCNAGDLDSIPGSERFPGKGNDHPLQYSCLPWTVEPGGLQSMGLQSRTRLND